MFQKTADLFIKFGGLFFDVVLQFVFVGGFFEFDDGMIKDFDAAEKFRVFHILRPSFVAAANRDGQDRNVGFERETNCARFEREHFAVGKFARAFGKNDERGFVRQSRFCRAPRFDRAAAFQTDRKRAEITNHLADEKPIEGFVISHKTHFSMNFERKPEWIGVSLMIRHDQKPARCVLRNVFGVVIFYPPENFADAQTENTAKLENKWRRILIGG